MCTRFKNQFRRQNSFVSQEYEDCVHTFDWRYAVYSQQESIVIGEVFMITLKLFVENTGEAAYGSTLAVYLPNQLRFVLATGTRVGPHPNN